MEFTPHLDDADLADLRTRLGATRWPSAETADDQGLALAEAQRLTAYWRDGYDVERLRRRLTSVPQVRVGVDGLHHHALHLRSSRADATPVLLAHGWPSTSFEFLDAARLLAEPEDASEPAFHVVCPSLPGYAYSDQPSETGWNSARIADAWAGLMTQLGYDTFLAHGGDWGALVTTELALRHPDRLSGLHLTMPWAGEVTEEDRANADAEERRGLERQDAYRRSGFGYALIQMTRPQSLGYGLEDSPAGLAGWIGEKLQAWAGRDDDGASLLSDDAQLDILTVYWLTRTATSSARMYYESLRTPATDPVDVPTCCSIFTDETLRPPRSAVARRYRDLRSWRTVPAGGHFPAAEVPELFAAEVRAAARTLAG